MRQTWRNGNLSCMAAFLGTLFLLLGFGRASICYGEGARGKLSQAKNFVCYYGSGNQDLLSQFDIVILEPRNYSASGIREIKARGAKVVGYLSLGEDTKLRKGMGKGIGDYAGYYLDANKDGKPDRNKKWGGYYVNAGDPEWVEFICHQANEILTKGCDGFFLDTLDTVELYPSTSNGMVNLIKRLKANLNDALVIANRGISILDKIAPIIDGEMVESFTSTYDWNTKSYRMLNEEEIQWVDHLAKRIRRLQKRSGFTVLILDYTQKDDFTAMACCKKRAKKFGSLCSFADINLSEIYPRRDK